MDDVVAMSLTCTRCHATVKNDLPRSQVPTQLDFLHELRAAGWSICDKAWFNQTHKCPKCASSS